MPDEEKLVHQPLCFVIMPFNKKKDADGNEIDFDEVYKSLIHPAIKQAGMEPIRADEETVNGIIHKPMYERLILCDYAVADLTTANANVFYEIGIRHAVKPYTTVNIFAAGSKLPFDLNAVRCLPYSYDKDEHLTNTASDIENLSAQLIRAKKDKTTDSPVYQLVDGISFQNSVAHEKTDIFRDEVKYNQEMKQKLAAARKTVGSKQDKISAVDAIVNSLKPEDEEAGVLIDIMLSYRSLDFQKMIDFIRLMPVHVQGTVMVQEQLGFALNRVGKKEDAINVLERVIDANGPSSETYGILGRVYKDMFTDALENGNEFKAEGYLDKSLETYQKGFEADWRDAYPGVNAITLLGLKGDTAAIGKLAPVVEFAVRRKMASKEPEYWDYATLMELAVNNNDEANAKDHLKKALTCPIEKEWMFDTSINNLKLLHRYKEQRGEDIQLTGKMIKYLEEQKNS